MTVHGNVSMFLPRVKPEHMPYRLDDGRVRIGGVLYGIAAEIEDPNGSVWTLLESMDGSRTPDEVVARVLHFHPRESEEEIYSGLESLCSSGYAEDIGSPDPAELSEREKARYSNSRAYFRWLDQVQRGSTWEPQIALRNSRVTIVGLGGTGGNAALALAASGVGKLHCVDSDRVELSNLNRQIIYDESAVGQSKVDSAIRKLRALNSDVDVTGTQQYIKNVEDLIPFAEDSDAILMAADRPSEIRSWANRACLATKTPWVESGYHGPLVTIGTYVPGEGACWECLRTAQREQHNQLYSKVHDAAHRGEAVGGNAVAAPSAGLSGYLAAHAVLGLLTGIAPAPTGCIYAFNLFALNEPYIFDSVPSDICPDCGRSGSSDRKE